jgi:hypothetical protein
MSKVFRIIVEEYTNKTQVEFEHQQPNANPAKYDDLFLNWATKDLDKQDVEVLSITNDYKDGLKGFSKLCKSNPSWMKNVTEKLSFYEETSMSSSIGDDKNKINSDSLAKAFSRILRNGKSKEEQKNDLKNFMKDNKKVSKRGARIIGNIKNKIRNLTNGKPNERKVKKIKKLKKRIQKVKRIVKKVKSIVAFKKLIHPRKGAVVLEVETLGRGKRRGGPRHKHRGNQDKEDEEEEKREEEEEKREEEEERRNDLSLFIQILRKRFIKLIKGESDESFCHCIDYKRFFNFFKTLDSKVSKDSFGVTDTSYGKTYIDGIVGICRTQCPNGKLRDLSNVNDVSTQQRSTKTSPIKSTSNKIKMNVKKQTRKTVKDVHRNKNVTKRIKRQSSKKISKSESKRFERLFQTKKRNRKGGNSQLNLGCGSNVLESERVPREFKPTKADLSIIN